MTPEASSPQPIDAEDVREIAEKFAARERAQAAFGALYLPWAAREFRYPQPDGYRQVFDALDVAEAVLTDNAVSYIRTLLQALGEAQSGGNAPIERTGQTKEQVQDVSGQVFRSED